MQKLCLALTLAAISAPALAADPTGDWYVEEKLSVIRVEPCGDAMCGTIGWTKEPGVDKNNPDPAKRTQSIVGVQILRGMKPAGADRWEGEIYNPKDGKTYKGNITLKSANALAIQGCVMGFLCGGETWSRAKCDSPAPSPAAASRRPPSDKSSKSTTGTTTSATAAALPLTGCRDATP